MFVSSWIDAAPWPVFGISAALMFGGLLAMVWGDAVRLKFLETVPLNAVERDHPHIPSVQVITGIVLCAAALLLVAVPVLGRHAFLGWDIARLNLVALFALAAGVATFAELKRGSADYAFAAVAGTSLAFGILLLAQRQPEVSRLVVIGLLMVLCACAGLARLLLFRGWSWRVHAGIVAVAAAWVGVALAG